MPKKPFRSEAHSTLERPIVEDLSIDITDFILEDFNENEDEDDAESWDARQQKMEDAFRNAFPKLLGRFVSGELTSDANRETEDGAHQTVFRFRELFLSDYATEDSTDAEDEKAYQAVGDWFDSKLTDSYRAALESYVTALPRKFVLASKDLEDKRYHIRSKVLRLEFIPLPFSSTYELGMLFDWSFGIQVESVEA